MAHKLIGAFLLVVIAAGISGCDQPVGPKDKEISGKAYGDIVNSTVPKDEQGQKNTMRDAALPEGTKR